MKKNSLYYRDKILVGSSYDNLFFMPFYIIKYIYIRFSQKFLIF